MKTIAYIRWADPPLWIASLANLFPLWLLSFAFMAGAFGLGITAFIISIVVLLWLGWFTPELILYSLFPFASLFIFEEVPVRYEIPFRLLCVLLLTLGIVGYRLSTHKNSLGIGWLILLVVFIGTWMLASNANQNYWQMVVDLGYGCDPRVRGCAPVSANATPWWVLFFRLT